MQARIVLAADAEPGLPNGAIAARLGMSRQSVTTWRGRFLAHRPDGLVDAPRSGAPRSGAPRRVGDEAMITQTLESQPEGATPWSMRTMARQVGEKPQIQAVEGTAPVLPMRLGQIERHSHDDRRHGTTDLFAALDVMAGTVIGACKGRHRATELRAFLDQIEAAVPTDLDIHRVLDNAATHKTRIVHDGLLRRPRWHLHVTPRFGILAQPRRGVVRAADPPLPAARCLQQHRRAWGRHPRLHQSHQRRPQAVPLDQNSGRHPGQHRALLPENF